MGKIIPLVYPILRGLPDHAIYTAGLVSEIYRNNWISNQYIHMTCNKNFKERKCLGFDFFVDYQKTYATQLNEFYQSQLGLSITQPNHLLALSYAQANDKLAHPMQLLPILRIGAGHDQADQNNPQFASASAIRKMVTSPSPQWQRLQEVAPDDTIAVLKHAKLVTWDDCFDLLKYRILTSSIPELQQIYQMYNMRFLQMMNMFMLH